MRATVRERQHLELAAVFVTLIVLLDAQTAAQNAPVPPSNFSRQMFGREVVRYRFLVVLHSVIQEQAR